MKKRHFILFLVSLILTVSLGLSGVWIVREHVVPQFRRITIMQNREVISIHDHLGLNPNITGLVVDDTLVRTFTPWDRQNAFAHPLQTTDAQHLENIIPPFVRSGVIYLPASFLQYYIDPFIFWDEGAGMLFISTHYDMLEFTPGRTNFYLNGSVRQLNAPILREGGETFLPACLVEGLYVLWVDFAPEYNIAMITDTRNEVVFGEVTANRADVRYRPELRAPIATQLAEGDWLHIFGSIDEEFVRVRTNTGIVGYIIATDIIESPIPEEQRLRGVDRPPILSTFIDNFAHRPPRWDGGKINLVWEQSNNQTANYNRMQIPFHDSLMVVSPSWFELNRDIMGISSAASREYVNWAHEQGVLVWPKVFDLNNATARDILMARDARRTVINHLVEAIQHYNLDGININFEHLAAPQGPYKIQFLRELSVATQYLDVVLSAAVLVPMDWSRFYRRDLIALTVDFVMAMTYDEHWNTSPVAGPVASLPWVQQGIENMLQQMPAAQLLLGLPFYNRVWREVVLGDTPPRALNWTMDYTRDFFDERDVSWEWDTEVGSYYVYFLTVEEGETIRYRVWLEDERSIAAKMQVFVAYDLAGVAGWRRLQESADVWDVIANHF